MNATVTTAGQRTMTIDQIRHASAELDLLRRQRELLFWTITMMLALIILTALTVAFLFSLIKGDSLDGAYTAAAGVSGAALVRIMRGSRAPQPEPGGERPVSRDP
jgi:hypothetical protein